MMSETSEQEPCDLCLFPDQELPRGDQLHRFLYCSDRSVSCRGSRSCLAFFMARNVNKNIALDGAVKPEAWGIIPSQDSH